MRRLMILGLPLMLATLACNFSLNGTASSTRPSLNANRPSVVWLAPPQGSTYALGTEIILYAQAQDAGGMIERIEFLNDFDEIIQTVSANPPATTLSADVRWQPPNAQSHFIKVRAVRSDGTESPLEEIVVRVVPAPEGFPTNTNTENTDDPLPPSPTPALEGQSQAPPPGSDPPTTANSTASDTAAEPPTVGAGGAEVPSADSAPQQDSPPPAEPTQAETVASLPAVVTLEAANVRVAPDVTAQPARDILRAGEQITLVWRTEDNQWYAIELPNGSFGWVFGGALEIQGDPTTLPLATTEQ